MLSNVIAALLMAAGAACDRVVVIEHEASSISQMQDHIAQLQRNVQFDTKTLPRMRTQITESVCPLYLLSTMCTQFNFIEEKILQPLRKPRPGDPASKRVFHGLFVHDDEDWFNTTVFVKRDVLRRARNTLSTPVTLTREKSSVNIDSTTAGWTVGAQLSGGYFGLPGGTGTNFAQAGVSVSGSYSSQTTKGTQVSVSDVSSFTCPPKHTCRSELWTTYVKVTGVCQSHVTFQCGSYSVDPCRTEESFRCDQIDLWRDRVCKPLDRVSACEIVMPITESGDKPYVVEVFFEDPIPSLFEKPTITGYRAGVYLLGSENYCYDPDREEDPYWTPEKLWHADKTFPTLDVSVFKHTVPHATDKRETLDGTLFKLDTEEWYFPAKGTDKKYYTESKGWFAKPTAPPPTDEDMASLDI